MYELTHTKTRSQCFKRAPLWSGDCFRKPALSCPKTVPFIKRRKNIFVFKNIPTRVDGAKEWRQNENGTGRIFDRLKNLTGHLVYAGQFNTSLHSMELWTARRPNFCTRLKSEFAFFQSLSRLSQLAYFVKCEQTTKELNSSEPYPSSERQRKFRPRLFTSSIKRETMGILTS